MLAVKFSVEDSVCERLTLGGEKRGLWKGPFLNKLRQGKIQRKQ